MVGGGATLSLDLPEQVLVVALQTLNDAGFEAYVVGGVFAALFSGGMLLTGILPQTLLRKKYRGCLTIRCMKMITERSAWCLMKQLILHCV